MDAALFREPRRRMIPIRSPWGDGDMAVLDFGDAGRPVDLVFVHANGFNAMTYRGLLAPLAATLRIVAPDLRGHGETRLKAEPKGRRSWKDYRDDLAALLEALGGPPVTLAGHSMGATAALLAAAERPDRVSNLVLFDPVVWTRWQTYALHLPGMHELARARFPPIRSAVRRRRRFDTRTDAMKAYLGRGAFARWPETTLADYVAGGFHEREGGVELACSPEWEASNFASQAHDPWKALARLDRPVRVLRAERGSTCRLGAPSDLKRRFPHARLQIVAGGTHFFPMERPEVVRDALLDAAV